MALTMTAEELKAAVAEVAAKFAAQKITENVPTEGEENFFSEYDALVAGIGQSLQVPILKSLEADDAEFVELAARTENLVSTAELVMMIVDKAISVATNFLPLLF